MLNVQLFFAVAGALLISNAGQARATDRPDCWSKRTDSKTCVKLASGEAERAAILLEQTQLENCTAAVQALKDAQIDFQEFQKKEELHRSLNALSLLLIAFEKAEACCKSDVGRCPSILYHIGNSIECTIAAIYKQFPGDVIQHEIGDLKIQHFNRGAHAAHAKDAYLFGLEVSDLFDVE